MAHEVEKMLYVGKEPWHGLGVQIPEGKKLSIKEAITVGGLNWTVVLRPLWTEDNKNKKVAIIDNYSVCRSSDSSVLGVVGPDYTPLQNQNAFKWFQPFLDSGQATIETAGSLKFGRKVRVLAKIRNFESTISNHDEIHHYVLLSNSHDGN
jgi:phage/plasmid-like protein (TIGR03299 family)